MESFDLKTLKQCPVCGSDIKRRGHGIIENQRQEVLEFPCGLMISADRVIHYCRDTKAYGWRRALSDLEITRYGRTDDISLARLLKRGDELVEMVHQDRETLVLAAAKMIWKQFVLDGFILQLHNPSECPMLARAETFGSFPCKKCHPAMAYQWSDVDEGIKEDFLSKARGETQLEWELAATLVKLLGHVRQGRSNG